MYLQLMYLELMYLQLMYLQLMYLQLMYLQLMYLQLMYLQLMYLQLMYLQLMYLQLMYLQLMYLQSHIHKNIPVNFDFITTWNQGVFFCVHPVFYFYWKILEALMFWGSCQRYFTTANYKGAHSTLTPL